MIEDTRFTKLEMTVDAVKEDLIEVKDVLADIALSLRTLTTIEAKQGQLVSTINDHEKRLRDIEKDMPNLKLSSGWILKCVVGLVGIIGAFVISVVLHIPEGLIA